MRRILVLIMLFILPYAWATTVFTPNEFELLKKNFEANILNSGAVIASPSRNQPDYYYDWVRDGAIAMDLIASWYDKFKKPADKEKLLNYVQWVHKIQHAEETIPAQDILGEPKFYLDGRPYDGPWGRPQNDGPALRALTLIRFAHTLLHDNEFIYVKTFLYQDGMDPMTMGVIKLDLEYTAHHWQEDNFDLWEEVYGQHFFTRMVQRKALIEGAKLARELGENNAADFYEKQAILIKEQLHKHIDINAPIIQATIAPHPGPQKTQELDSAVILAVLLSNNQDQVFAPDNFYVKNTVAALREQFIYLYPINHNHSEAILFGRYPGDTYDGYGNSLGNPWFILTATIAEYYYSLANLLPPIPQNQQQINDYLELGDEYLKLIKIYAPNLTMSEQINLHTGQMQGAYSLTWSYVATLRAIDARSKIAP